MNEESKTGFWEWIRELGITRNDNERWLAGVAGGIAERTKLDPLIWRGIFVVLTLFGGPGLLLYIVGWLFLPNAQGRIHMEDVFRGAAQTWVMVTVVVLAVVVGLTAIGGVGGSVIFGLTPWAWGGGFSWVQTVVSVFWWIAVVGATIWFAVWIFSRENRRDSADERSAETTSAKTTSADTTSVQTTSADTTSAQTTSAETTSADTTTEASWSAASEDFTTRVTDGANRFADGATQAGERFAASATHAGERFSEAASRFGETVTETVSEVEKSYEKTALDPGHKILTLAIALLAGGAVSSLGFFDAVAIDPTNAMLLGFATALAVFGLSSIIAGIRGRRTGWIGFLSFVGVLALLFGTFAPPKTEVRVVESQPTEISGLAAGESESSLSIVGNATMDLGGLDRRGSELGGHLTIMMIAGRVEIVLPDRAPVRVESRILAGNAESEASSRSGPLVVTTEYFNVDNTNDLPVTTVTIWLVAGSTAITEGA